MIEYYILMTIIIISSVGIILILRYNTTEDRIAYKLIKMDQEERNYILTNVRMLKHGYLEGDERYLRCFDFTERKERQLDRFVNKNIKILKEITK